MNFWGCEMIERLLLASTLTFSLYLFLLLGKPAPTQGNLEENLDTLHNIATIEELARSNINSLSEKIPKLRIVSEK